MPLSSGDRTFIAPIVTFACMHEKSAGYYL